MGDFYEKPHFTMENFKFREAVKWGLKIFAPNYQKAHPYAKSGRTNRDIVLTLRRREKSMRESPLENRVVYNTTSLPRRRDLDNSLGRPRYNGEIMCLRKPATSSVACSCLMNSANLLNMDKMHVNTEILSCQ